MNWVNVVLTPDQIEILLDLCDQEIKGIKAGEIVHSDPTAIDELQQIHNVLIQKV
jgi:hypothetical protein